METLKLDCETVSSVGSSIAAVANEMTDLGEKIANYELDESDDFNFITPCSAVKANVLNSAEKMTNTSEIINTVIENHTEIQNGLTFDNYVEGNVPTVSSAVSTSVDTSASPSYSNPASIYSAAGAYYSTAATTIAETYGVTQESTENESSTTIEKEEIKEEEKKLVKSIAFGANLSAPALGFITSSSVSKDNEIDDRLEIEYDEKTGLAKVDGNYVVRCDDTIGKVGDAVIITTASGTAVNCVVGSTYKAEEGKASTLEFYSNSKEETITNVEGVPNKEDAIVKADNYGSIDEEKYKEDETENQTNADKKLEDKKEDVKDEEKKETETKEPENKTTENINTNGEIKEEVTEEPKQEEEYKFPEITVGNTGNTEVTITSTPVIKTIVTQPETPKQEEPVTQTPVYNWTTEDPVIKENNEDLSQITPYIINTGEEENDGGNN